MIELKNVTKDYGKGQALNNALRGVNLQIRDSEFIAIMGASGSGKSTLLNILGCMDTLSGGEYYFGGKAVHEMSTGELDAFRANHISFVFQHFALMNQYTVYENAELPLLCRGVKSKQRKATTIEVLKQLKIDHLKDKQVNNISGGEAQRCAIARAMISGNEIILCDEPTGALDKKTGITIMECLKKLNKSGRTVVMVTHDESIAKWADRIFIMEDGILTEQETNR